MFSQEAEAIRQALAPWLVAEPVHIGSTAVPGLAAKPVIDIMAPVHDLVAASPAIAAASSMGYCHYPYKAEQMHWFCKPSPLHRTHHLHLVPWGSVLWHEQLAFRDALRDSAELASQYEKLKRALSASHPHDREAYTQGKSSFVAAVLAAWRAKRQGAH
jgi:GrpB-like predicted nucleotidyltransferase (UPF0157 family)